MQADQRVNAGLQAADAADVATAREPIAIICGGGSFPGAVAEAIARRGREPVMFGVKGWADSNVIERYRHHWIAIGQVGRFFRLARAEGCREALLIGTLLRPPLTQIRLDWQTIRLMPRAIGFFRGGDDQLLSGLARLMEEGGLRIVGVKDAVPEIIVPEGVLGRYQPSPRDRADIARGLELIAALGPFDVGQAVVVANNHVLAVEAAEGTDNLLTRIADLKRQRRVVTPPGVGVLVKAPKPGQDRRFDLPAIGPQTVENVARAGLAGLAIAAGSTIIAEAAEVSAAADRAKIFLVGVREETAR
ncbi:MAG TPA: UDP-2,3-diacylglucosamine diphosphatase LpxI [Xanthobacteraceae bacterium]|nr:UDP-2,3-diacylglucosamine diphosphatase LpxI [Xanthobacteraceae bacterium]